MTINYNKLILCKYTDGNYYEARIIKVYRNKQIYIKWKDNSCNDRIKSFKNIIYLPKKNTQKYGIQLLLKVASIIF
jgi:hypothetical protein